jgi:two-component system, cell cycle response regulator
MALQRDDRCCAKAHELCSPLMQALSQVLVVDDAPVNVALVSALVDTIPGLKAVGFNDPSAALDWCLSEEPVLVLLDYEMPHMNGAQFVHQLRAREDGVIIPVVIVSGHEDRSILLEALAAGASDFIRKPLDEVEVIARVKSLAQLGGATRRLATLATVDDLTGLENRRRFMAHLNSEVQRAHRYVQPLSVIMFDVDHFKQINDSAGHSAGDQTLQKLAELTLSMIRGADFVGRLGGEEFAWVLPSSNLAEAKVAAERHRLLIEGTDFGISRKITCSLGVATLQPAEQDAELLARADAFLYEAKQSGRNCVRSG